MHRLGRNNKIGIFLKWVYVETFPLRFSKIRAILFHVRSRPPPLPDLSFAYKSTRLILFFRQLLGNGTLYFPPFLAQDFRAEVHNARYRCRATSSVGTVLSREVTLRAGELFDTSHPSGKRKHSLVDSRESKNLWSLETLKRASPQV